jgi:NAD(P)-dependent dehydrogenase (short-subunit alcohol dehydrogenase family)
MTLSDAGSAAKSAPVECLVIGAAGGIGQALVPRLRRLGLEPVLAGRTESALRALAAGAEAVEVLDACDFDAVAALLAQRPRVRAAVNLAGSILLKPAAATSAVEFGETVALNLSTAFALVRAAGKHWREGGGSLVLMSSCAATVGLANHEAIAAAKAGVEGLTRAAAATLAPLGVRVNAVAPGLVDTPLAARLTKSEAALRASVALHPLGRIGTADEVAEAIAFLLSPASAWTTGQVLGVDGGLARLRPR